MKHGFAAMTKVNSVIGYDQGGAICVAFIVIIATHFFFEVDAGGGVSIHDLLFLGSGRIDEEPPLGPILDEQRVLRRRCRRSRPCKL